MALTRGRHLQYEWLRKGSMAIQGRCDVLCRGNAGGCRPSEFWHWLHSKHVSESSCIEISFLASGTLGTT